MKHSFFKQCTHIDKKPLLKTFNVPKVLAAGGQVKLVYASRNRQQVLLRSELATLLETYPGGQLSVRHCLSQPNMEQENQQACATKDDGICTAGSASGLGDVIAGKVSNGRIDMRVTQEVFGDWGFEDGLPEPLFLVVGTRRMGRAMFDMLGEYGLGARLLTGGTGWRPLVPDTTLGDPQLDTHILSSSQPDAINK